MFLKIYPWGKRELPFGIFFIQVADFMNSNTWFLFFPSTDRYLRTTKLFYISNILTVLTYRIFLLFLHIKYFYCLYLSDILTDSKNEEHIILEIWINFYLYSNQISKNFTNLDKKIGLRKIKNKLKKLKKLKKNIFLISFSSLIWYIKKFHQFG